MAAQLRYEIADESCEAGHERVPATRHGGTLRRKGQGWECITTPGSTHARGAPVLCSRQRQQKCGSAAGGGGSAGSCLQGGSAGGGSSAARVQPATGRAGGAPEGGACGGGRSSGPAPRACSPAWPAAFTRSWRLERLERVGLQPVVARGRAGLRRRGLLAGGWSAAAQMPVHCIKRPAAGPAAPALATHA